MKTINVILKGPGKISLQILPWLFKKNKFTLEHKQIRDTKMVREISNLQAATEGVNLFILGKWSPRENILTQKLDVKTKGVK